MHLSGPTKLQLWIENWKELGVSTLICLGFLPLNSLYIYILYWCDRHLTSKGSVPKLIFNNGKGTVPLNLWYKAKSVQTTTVQFRNGFQEPENSGEALPIIAQSTPNPNAGRFPIGEKNQCRRGTPLSLSTKEVAAFSLPRSRRRHQGSPALALARVGPNSCQLYYIVILYNI